ncbi:MAG: primosomal protein N' [Proteobacteria bacterium]|nr:primosomal protein N' [Pseudomonadota bacterium]
MAKKLVERIYQISIPNTRRDHFSYKANLDKELEPGVRVLVPFRNKLRLGIVIALNEDKELQFELKEIAEVIDEKAILSEEILNLCRFVSQYYQAPLSEVLLLAIPKLYRLGKPVSLPQSLSYELIVSPDEALELINKRASSQKKLITLLKEKPIVNKEALAGEKISQQAISALLNLNLIKVNEVVALPFNSKEVLEEPLILNEEQKEAVSQLKSNLNQYHCSLLQGVTGSGKTEVYLQLLEEVLVDNNQALILVPEIGLTPQLVARFLARFKEPLVVIHSNLNETERQSAWQLAANGIAKIVIGTRAAIFTPLPHLKLIIIDEEHDSSFKQMEGVRYSAKDTALMRAHKLNIPILLGSATPSLETLYNCEQAKYSLLKLTKKAMTETPLYYELIDVRNTSLNHGLAPKTMAKINTHLQKGNQVLVFINRRGFSPVLLCHSCGWMADCKACASHFTLHRKPVYLICHHCGTTKHVPPRCENCQAEELIPIGAGTQRVHEYLAEEFPNEVVLRVDRDEVSKKHAFANQLERINQGEAKLIVGTQMLAKGHHFPRLSLVVILDADAGFYNYDFRAIERLGQLLTQVSGRAGRADRAGEVLIQTHVPDNPLLNILIQQGYDAFAKRLLMEREKAALPPYHYMALLRAQDRVQEKVLNFLHLAKTQLEDSEIKVLGPAPAPMPFKALQHRMQLLVKCSSRKILHRRLTNLRAWLTMNKIDNNIRWNVDIDPVDLS